MRSAARCGRWRAVSTALLLALLGALVAAQPATGEDRDLNPWLRPATFETTGGTHWLAITEATPGDPVMTARWVADDGRLALRPGPRTVVGAGGGVVLTGLDAGTWLVATESTISWATAVDGAGTGGSTLDLMSFNLRYDNPSDTYDWPTRRGPILEMVDERRPDVLGVQEALAHQVEQLANGLPEYGWVGVGRDDGRAAGEFAAIFYRTDRLELIEHGTFWLSETPDVPSVGWDAVLPRIATWAELRRPGADDSFVVINTHFDHVGTEARVRSAELIAEKTTEIAGGRPSFVMGDLNVAPSNEALLPILATMDDTRSSSVVSDPIGSFNAFFAPGGLWNLDYVFHDHGRALEFETVDDDYGVAFISDHYPIVATVECRECG